MVQKLLLVVFLVGMLSNINGMYLAAPSKKSMGTIKKLSGSPVQGDHSDQGEQREQKKVTENVPVKTQVKPQVTEQEDKILGSLADAYKLGYRENNQDGLPMITLILLLDQLKKAHIEEKMSYKDLAKVFRIWLTMRDVPRVDSMHDFSKHHRTLYQIAELCGEYEHAIKVLDIVRLEEKLELDEKLEKPAG